MKYFLENCCTRVGDAVTAQINGAARIELCSCLDIGGITPSEELVRATLLALAEEALQRCRVPALAGSSLPPIPVNVLVRPSGGNFVYNESEIQETIAGIEMCKRLIVKDSSGVEHKVNGVVLGALRADGGIDMAAMRRLTAAARPLHVTFHRAFDVCADVECGLEDVIALGCERPLTSGHEPDAFTGRFTLARLVLQAAGRIVILAGCGVRPHNIDAIASASGATEFHSSTLTGW